MSGIPAHLLQQLRKILFNCGPFDKHNELLAVFLDERISLWRAGLPDGGSAASRVNQTVYYLLPKYNRNQDNGLVLLLRVLSDQTDPDDICQQQLAETADLLERELRQLNSNTSVIAEVASQNNVESRGSLPETPQHVEVLPIDSKILPWTESGELSEHGQSQLTQIIEFIKSSPPSQISDADILDMENTLHQIYHYPENPIASPVRAWVGEALDAMFGAASIAVDNPGKRPREVPRNLRTASDALANALVQNDIIELSKPTTKQ